MGILDMGENKLRTAVLGLGDGGKLLLEAASGIDYFQIEAVADKDGGLAEKTAVRYDCAAYDDFRQMIIQRELDCLLVAAGIHICDEHIRTAIKKGCNIVKLPPAGRDFEEAAEFVHLAEEKEVKFAIANTRRFSRGFLGLRRFLDEGGIEQIFLIRASCGVGKESYPKWQTDPKLAGGGVLLYNCHQIIDQIVWNFGMPEQVYSLSASAAGDKQQRLYLTEDTAVVTMKFSDTFVGNLVASRRTRLEREEELLKVYGKDKTLTVNRTGLTVSDYPGRTSEESEYEDDDELLCTAKLLENFALSILLPDKNRLCSSGSENLRPMAVIESAYLSARTGTPEEPGRIFERGSRRAGKPINI